MAIYAWWIGTDHPVRTLQIIKHSNGDAWIEAQGKPYSPQQIGAVSTTSSAEKLDHTANALLYRAVRCTEDEGDRRELPWP